MSDNWHDEDANHVNVFSGAFHLWHVNHPTRQYFAEMCLFVYIWNEII